MKVAHFAESSADQAAITILTETILGRKTEPVLHGDLRQRGWPSVRTVLPSVLKQLHYHTEAEGLVLVVDSNGSPPHLQSHEEPNAADTTCRLCQLHRLAKDALSKVSPVPNRPSLKVAIGIAVPAIEAWLLCGVDAHVTESAWTNAIKKDRRGGMTYTKPYLKQQLYGTSRPSIEVETKAMTAAATRLSRDLSTIQQLFPHGFGALVRSLKSW